MKATEVLIYIKDKIDLKGLATLQTKLGKLRLSIKAAFNSAPVRTFRNAVLAVGAAFVAAVVEGARFNVQMARVWTMAGGGIKNFKSLRKEARGLAADFGKARSEIATGMYTALSAGVDRSNLESFMRSAAQVAVADGSEISVAVDGITTVLNAFHIEAEETEEVTDLLFQTVRTGKTTFQELSSSLSNVASTAASSHIPLKQILAHIAALTAQGTPTAQATTQIRQSIIGMNKAMGDGWSATMTYQEGLKAVWKQSGESQTQLLKLVGSTEAVAAVLGGVGENADAAADKLAGMADAAGAAKEAFDKVNQFRHWPTLLETARGALSKFGEEVDQRIRPFVVAVTEQIREWTDNESLWDKIRSVMDAAADRLQAAGRATAEIVSQINSMADLKVLAQTIGDWLKVKLEEGGRLAAKFILEKAPVIGDAIGMAVWDSLTKRGRDNPSSEQRQDARNQAKSEGGSFYDQTQRYSELYYQTKDSNRSNRLAGEGANLAAKVELSEASMQTFSEIFSRNLQQSDQAAAVSDLASMLASGMSAGEINGIVQSWELNQDELQVLMDSIEASAESTADATEAAEESAKAATEMQDATAKSLDASTQANTAVQSAMETTSVISQQTIKVAERMVDLGGQNQDQVAQLIGVVGQLKQRMDQQDFEIQALKV